MFKNKKITSVLAATALVLQLALPAMTQAQSNSVSVQVKDAVAGYPVKLQTSVMNLSQADMGVFFITQPNGTVVRVNAKKNDIYSVLTGELFGQQTRQAGVYTASVLLPGGISSAPVSFRIHPGNVSLTQSEVKALDPLLSVNQKGNLQVTLKDDYGNVKPNSAVQLFSSRPGDTIYPVNDGKVGDENQFANTDKKGRAYFEMSSPHSGAATFTALHLNQPLQQRAEVVFSQSLSSSSGMGGNFLSSNLLGANVLEAENDPQQAIAGPVDSFVIEAPATVMAGEDVSVTVTAVDANGIVTPNYTGTVLLGVMNDDNATFPDQYQFTEADQGKHVFNLGFRFNTTGTVKVQAFDAENFQLGGETQLTVQSAGSVNVSVGPRGSQPEIKSPASGTTVGTPSVTITGMADTFKNISLFVDGVKTKDLSTDGSGFFSTEVTGLNDGPHDFYVMVQEQGGGGQVSATTTVTVDSTAPTLQSIALSPELQVYEPGQAITAMVVAEPNLDSASLTVQGIAYPLTPGVDPGSYSTTFAAPSAGQYAIKASLTDSLFNKAEYDAATFTVQAAPELTLPPAKVSGLQGQAGEGSLTLVWNSVQGETSIQKYTVHYGLAFDQLTKSMEVAPDKTNATISNLTNGTTYYANITATDSKGLVSEPSVTLALKPKEKEQEIEMPEIMDPEVIEVITGNETPNPPPLPSTDLFPVQPSISTMPAEGGIILQWELGTKDEHLDPSGYMIYFGVESGQYTDSYYVKGNVKSALVPDLIPGIQYYFAVIPVDMRGQEMEAIFEEVTGVAGSAGSGLGADLLGAAHDQPGPLSILNNDALAAVDKNADTGPEVIWVVILSLIVSPMFYLYRRKISA